MGLKPCNILFVGQLKNRLNRTSVGLKHEQRPHPVLGQAVPQSNQRGIETVWAEWVVIVMVSASIEPAWD